MGWNWLPVWFDLVIWLVYPFKAVYAYTPSKLPSSFTASLKETPAQETIVSAELEPSVSQTDPDEATVADHSTECAGEGIGTVVVYSRRNTETQMRCSSGLDEVRLEPAAAVGPSNPLPEQSSGIRRSCSLDGVALASRCHGDDLSSRDEGQDEGRSRNRSDGDG